MTPLLPLKKKGPTEVPPIFSHKTSFQIRLFFAQPGDYFSSKSSNFCTHLNDLLSHTSVKMPLSPDLPPPSMYHICSRKYTFWGLLFLLNAPQCKAEICPNPSKNFFGKKQ